MPRIRTNFNKLDRKHPYFHDNVAWNNCGTQLKSLTIDLRTKSRIASGNKYESKAKITEHNGTGMNWICTLCWKPIGEVKGGEYFCDAYSMMEHFHQKHNDVDNINVNDHVRAVKQLKPCTYGGDVKKEDALANLRKINALVAPYKKVVLQSAPRTPVRPTTSQNEESPNTLATNFIVAVGEDPDQPANNFLESDENNESEAESFLDEHGECAEERAKRAQEDAEDGQVAEDEDAQVCDIDPNDPFRLPPLLFPN